MRERFRKKISRKKILTAIVFLLIFLAIRIEQAFHEKPVVTPGSENLVFVKRVIDGDTIVLGNDERLRYLGINTPEIHHSTKGVEYYGPQAADFNKKLVLGKLLRFEFDKQRYDKYGRTLAYVYLRDGTFVNAELVRQGFARTMTIKPNTKYADLFRKLQEEAKIKKLGLWKK